MQPRYAGGLARWSGAVALLLALMAAPVLGQTGHDSHDTNDTTLTPTHDATPSGADAAGEVADETHDADAHSTVAQDEAHGGAHGGAQVDAHGGAHHGVDGAELALWMGIPFVGILLSIALFPLVAPHFWHHHFPKVSAFWGLLLAVPFVFMYKGAAVYEILHIYLADYIPFIILLWALYTVAGGILVTGSMTGSPVSNTVMLLIGTAIASWVGTTGAAMLLIRPFMRANAWRQNRTYQIVFFIFLVCNVGGSLTPLGDPPLFLGFLHKVPFFWTLSLLPPMATVASILLAMFFVLDTLAYRKEKGSPPAADPNVKFQLQGLHNLLFLGGIVAGVLVSGIAHWGEINVFGVHRPVQDLARDAFLILMGILSLRTTSRVIRERNAFTWFPILEVAYLFAGIFVTMIPVLLILKAGTAGHLGFIIESVKEPVHYFWITGGLSSFLDNAPTYLVFFNTALGNFSPGLSEAEGVAALIRDQEVYLLAIACGAVFMGANTYIGNAPNFMVRSIAEENGIKMPSFFGYILKYSLLILIPIFVLVTLIFFR